VKNIEERIKTMLRPGKKFYKRPSLIDATIVLLLALLTVPTALVLTARADSKTAEGDEALTRKSTEAAEVAFGYRPASDPNLVAWWRLDDGSGSSARDSSGNDNHGTLHGDPQWTAGKIGGALDFDGDGDYVDCGNPDMFNFDEQVTAGAWINLRSVPGSSRAIVAKGENGWRLALTRSTSGFEFAVAGRDFGYPGTLSGIQVAFGEWHHVCGTYDGETIRIYIDGQMDGTSNYTRGIATNNVNLLIGDNPQWTGRFWDGLIDDVFVFSRALSDDEIRVVMQGLYDPASARESGLADQVQTNSIGMKLVWIPPGEFMMGSKFSPHEVNRRYVGNPVIFQNEHPQRKVTLTRGFWMGESEVTQVQYLAVMGSNRSHAKGDNLPVEMVSWPEAMEFCKKLSEKEGRTYTLPTEAQWEYAARAGTDTAYSFGDDHSQLGEYAWFGSDSGWKTNPVKTKKPNAFGLYDVHCNVWEWCRDWYQRSYDGLGNVDPTGPKSGQSRVARGGAWHKYAGNCRSAVREAHNPDARNRYKNVGFRVVLLVAGVD
jgi:formylglycine-generating enzyme required for sulfatase activity